MTLWILFLVMILAFLAIDLGIFNKKAHIISYKEAAKWTALWASIAILFTGVIYAAYLYEWVDTSRTSSPLQASMKYLTGYIIELSLSVDNIFVIAMIFKSFRIPQKYQHRVLFWGIIGALIFRGLTIAFGVLLIEKFSWLIYVFGAFLIYTAYKMIGDDEEEEFDPKESFVYKTLRKFMPVTSMMEGEKFFLRKRGMIIATPLLLTLVLIEMTDILFALDSIPAILGITTDPFLVFTSNIFAILGLRSLYFFVANMLNSFHYLKYSLVVILSYVGVKMLLSFKFHLPIWLSLSVIVVSLGVGIIYSLRQGK